jgi:hypothetical protein
MKPLSLDLSTLVAVLLVMVVLLALPAARCVAQAPPLTPQTSPVDVDGDGTAEPVTINPSLPASSSGALVLGCNVLSVFIGNQAGDATRFADLDADGDGELEILVTVGSLAPEASSTVNVDCDSDPDLLLIGSRDAGGAAGGSRVMGAFEIDGDGELDVVLFDPTRRRDRSLVVDMDQDGDPDLVVVGAAGGATLAFGGVADIDFDGDVELRLLTEDLPPGTTFGIDVDGDGDPDLIYQASPTAPALGLPVLFDVPFGSGDGTATLVGGADVDQDGYDDFAIGSPTDATGGVDAGSLTVRSGLTSRVLFTVNGDPGDRLGASIAFVGDHDGDGYPDVAVGSPGDSVLLNGGPFSIRSGSVRVYSGATGMLLTSLYVPAFNAGFGASSAFVGDTNGDGIPEVAVGAPQQGGGAGSVHIMGLDGGLVTSFFGFPGDYLGLSLAGGDLDGDGTVDIVAGARPASTFTGGRVRVFDLRTMTQVFEAAGGFSEGSYGTTLAIIDDLNGDGSRDVLVGSPDFGFLGQLEGGRALALNGANGQLIRETRGVGGQRLGTAVAALGDINDDGVPEYVVGGDGDDTMGVDCGTLQVVSGVTGLAIREFFGDAVGAQLGRAVGLIGLRTTDRMPRVVSSLPGLGCVRALVPAGAQPYTATTGLVTRFLDWQAGTPSLPAGTLGVSGGTPGAPGWIVVSTDPSASSVSGFPLLVGVAGPVPPLFLPFSFDAEGTAAVPVNIAVPGAGDAELYAQAFETGAFTAASNGLGVVFADAFCSPNPLTGGSLQISPPLGDVVRAVFNFAHPNGVAVSVTNFVVTVGGSYSVQVLNHMDTDNRPDVITQAWSINYHNVPSGTALTVSLAVEDANNCVHYYYDGTFRVP